MESTCQHCFDFVRVATSKPINSPFPEYELWDGPNASSHLAACTLWNFCPDMRSVLFDVPTRPRLDSDIIVMSPEVDVMLSGLTKDFSDMRVGANGMRVCIIVACQHHIVLHPSSLHGLM
jgi:hypothetical protein